MNKKTLKKVLSIYKEGVTLKTCVDVISEMCKAQQLGEKETGAAVHKFFEMRQEFHHQTGLKTWG
jgi:hypothetical protein